MNASIIVLVSAVSTTFLIRKSVCLSISLVLPTRGAWVQRMTQDYVNDVALNETTGMVLMGSFLTRKWKTNVTASGRPQVRFYYIVHL
jgi:hypothetical protein